MESICPRCREREKGTSGYCTPCGTLRMREWRSLKREKKPPFFYIERLKAQKGHCAGCLRTDNNGKRFVEDHDHLTGKKRGLLCHLCNLAIGNAKDDPVILRRLAAYLENTKIPKPDARIDEALVKLVAIHLESLIRNNSVIRQGFTCLKNYELSIDLEKSGIRISDSSMARIVKALGWKSKTVRFGLTTYRCWVKNQNKIDGKEYLISGF